MESKKKAIYVHGLGSGAASTTIDIACDIARVIRETIEFGRKEYFVPAGVRNNQRDCYEIGYRILIDWEGGHRLKRQTLRLSWTHLFDE